MILVAGGMGWRLGHLHAEHLGLAPPGGQPHLESVHIVLATHQDAVETSNEQEGHECPDGSHNHRESYRRPAGRPASSVTP